LSASPSDATYQYAVTAKATPTSTAHGTHTNRHRRVRHPIAAISATTAMTWTVVGIQPCISDR
jgi:hypothetical protein